MSSEIVQNKKLQLHSKVGIIASNYRSEIGVGVSTIIFFLILCAVSPYFFTGRNMSNVISQIAIIAILSIGQTFVILTGGIDLSVANLMGLSSMVTAFVMVNTENIALGVMAGLLCGIIIGIINGVLVGYVGLPAFIVTMGMMSITRNADYLICSGRSITGLTEGFEKLTAISVIPGLPVYYIGILVLYIIAGWVLSNTKVGRYTYALGSNEKATRLCGVNIRLYKVIPYAISGMMAAIAGLILASRFMAVDPNYGAGNELDTVAAVVIGGATLTGGKGTLIGTAVGVFLMGFIRNGLDILGVSPYWQGVSVGLVIILALIVERLTNRNKKD
jgi:ribose transport system permease protein